MDKRYYCYFSLCCSFVGQESLSFTHTNEICIAILCRIQQRCPSIFADSMNAFWVFTDVQEKDLYNGDEELAFCITESEHYFFMVKHGSNHKHSDSFVILMACMISCPSQYSTNAYLQPISLPLHDPTLKVTQQGRRGQTVLHT